MTTTIKVRSIRLTDHTEIKILLTHPMENGRNRDPLNGQLIPAHFIRQLELALNGKIILKMNLGGSVSKNPFFTFRLKNSQAGDRLTVSWIDNIDNSDRVDHVIE